MVTQLALACYSKGHAIRTNREEEYVLWHWTHYIDSLHFVFGIVSDRFCIFRSFTLSIWNVNWVWENSPFRKSTQQNKIINISFIINFYIYMTFPLDLKKCGMVMEVPIEADQIYGLIVFNTKDLFSWFVSFFILPIITIYCLNGYPSFHLRLFKKNCFHAFDALLRHWLGSHFAPTSFCFVWYFV